MHETAEEMAPVDAAEVRSAVRERPWIFSLLIAPNAALANGVVQGGVLGYLLGQHGVSDERAGHIVSLLSLPTTIYFLWSPVTDFLVRRRTWLLLGAVLGGLLMAAGLMQPDLSSRAALLLMFAGACFGQLVVSACGGMMGALRSERGRRLAGSFYQGGSLAFGACSLLLLVPLSNGVHSRWVGPLAGLLIAVPGLAALAAPRQQVLSEESAGATWRRIAVEFRETFLRWRAVPYIFALGLPLTSGAAVSLLPKIAGAYGVSGAQVAWINGLGGALLMAGGSLTATLIPARWRASVVYSVMAILNAGTLCVLAAGPMRPWTYFAGVVLYVFTVGLGYAMFTAVLLEWMGASGRTGSGRYSVINSWGNVPVVLMASADGWGGTRFGPRGLTGTEAALGGAAGLVMLVWFVWAGRKKQL